MAESLEIYQIGDCELSLSTSNEVFEPNITTSRIAQLLEIPDGASVLDLGCGVGPLGIYAAKHGAGKVVSVDVNTRACELAAQNVTRLNLQDVITVRNGDLFAPIEGMKFDVIINDVSGIAELPGRVAGWYPPSVHTGGEDGASVVTRMFDRVVDFLNPDGILYFATSSLSNVTRILDSAKQAMGDPIEELGKFRIPFSRELTDAIEPLKKLCEQGYVSFEARRSRYVWTLSVFRCQFQG